MIAYCWASGLIEFGSATPEGAIPVAHGRAKRLREVVEGEARHGYATKLVDGRPTKIPGSDTLLVPGIPEAIDNINASDALMQFRLRLRKHEGIIA
jgi:hypothetical protein